MITKFDTSLRAYPRKIEESLRGLIPPKNSSFVLRYVLKYLVEIYVCGYQLFRLVSTLYGHIKKI